MHVKYRYWHKCIKDGMQHIKNGMTYIKLGISYMHCLHEPHKFLQTALYSIFELPQ